MTTQFDAVLSNALGADAGVPASTTAVVPSARGAGTIILDPSAPASQSGSVGQRAVALAKQHRGTPYVLGAESPSTGFDCSDWCSTSTSSWESTCRG
jgi:cell wall-associated NlpC family hydrolase